MWAHDDKIRVDSAGADSRVCPNWGARAGAPLQGVPAGFILLLLVWTVTAQAAEYHVDANHMSADDANSGTVNLPWKSLRKANSLLREGDTVYIHRGRYAEPIAPMNSGTSSAPIVYQSWGNDSVYLAENLSGEACIDLTNRSFVFVKGVAVREPGNNYPAYARMVGSQYCRVEDCHFSGSMHAYHGVILGLHDAERETSRNVFRNVSFMGCIGDLVLMRGDVHHNLFRQCYFSDAKAPKHHANLMIQGLQPHGASPSYNAFIDCEFFAVHHHAINLCGGPHHNLFDKCVIRNADENGNAIQMAASDSIFRRCLVIKNKGHIGSRDTLSLYSTRDEWFEEGKYYTYSSAKRNRIYNNTFAYNLGFAISCNYWPFGEEYPYGIGENVFLNNIFAFNGSQRDDVELYYNDGSGKISGDLWSHNLIGSDSKRAVMRWGEKHCTLAQCVETIPLLTFKDNIQGDPLFKSREKDDYSLRPGSPCIDKGRPLTYTTSSGTGTRIPVQDSKFFFDGFGLVPGDMIVVGKTLPVRVVSVPDEKHLIVAEAVSWEVSDRVSLPYEGTAPDIGAVEHVPENQGD
jgi:hypothetical protein